MDQYIGQLLDNRYEILEVIGTGGMAVVYKALCHRLNRLVAVKILKDEFAKDEEFLRRFQAEGEAVAMLSHPNIVQVFDVSATNNTYYIVMELINGISLKQYMEVKGILNWKETLHFASQIALGLEHAHSRGIVHRDIKPHNVMVLKNGSVKVMDFGIAQVMNKSSTLTKEALGSVHYISPEQAKGSFTDSRSDIYSLGVVMYEMMTGRPPYDGESPVVVAIQHINGGAPLPTSFNPNIPAGMEQIIMKAMALEPGDRYSSATELLQDLEEFRKTPTMTFPYELPRHTVPDDDTKKLQSLGGKPRTVAEKVAISRGGVVNPGGGRKQEPAVPAGRSKESLHRAQKRREEEARREAERSRIATIAVVACSVVAVIAIVVFLVAIFNGAMINRDRDLVEVPYLTGDMYDEEIGSRHPNFTIRLQPQQYDDFYVAGQIMHQEPAGGVKVAKGTEIFLTVSMGQEPKVKVMEDLVGVTLDRAYSFLHGQGLKPLVLEEPSDQQASGRVIRTEPEAGAELTDGQIVKIYVSTGPEIVEAKMPNVLDMEMDTALETLDEFGFKNVSTVKVSSNKVSKGYVVTQSETAYSVINVTTHITLEISDGPEIRTEIMPDVRGLDVELARQLLWDLGFQNVQTYPMESDKPGNQVVEQSEDPNNVVALTKQIDLGISNNTQQTEAPSTVPPSPVTKRVDFQVEERSEDYFLTICLKGHADMQVASGQIPAGTSSFVAELTGSGMQEYDLYIDGVFYKTFFVDFTNG